MKEVSPSTHVCICVCERDGRVRGGGEEGKRKTDMARMMEDRRGEHELILGI